MVAACPARPGAPTLQSGHVSRSLSAGLLHCTSKKSALSSMKFCIVRCRCKKLPRGQTLASKIGEHSSVTTGQVFDGAGGVCPAPLLEICNEYPAAHRHLHPDRRSSAAGDQCLPADHPHLHGPGGRGRRHQRHLGGPPHPGPPPPPPVASP